MSNGSSVTWRALWNETSALVGRPQARWICEVASGHDGDEFMGIIDRPATERGVAHLDAMLARVAAGEPLQYVLGRWGFRHLDLMVDRRVLIPRPETELVVDVALRLAHSQPEPVLIADLGTGSGAIGLSLATELPIDKVFVWMTDCSSDALDVARANAAGAGRAATSVRLLQGSWFDALPEALVGMLAMVVSNPPYVGDDDAGLEPVVREWEPSDALFGGADGLDEIRHIVAEAPRWLRSDGWLVLEIGSGHGQSVTELMRAAGFDDIEIVADLGGHDRVAIGRRTSYDAKIRTPDQDSSESSGNLTEQ